MNHWTNLRTWNTARFTVTLDWTWEDCPDLSWDDTGEVTAKLESGEFGNYTFRVRVTLDGREIASDYLGNSIYADPMEFAREHLGLAALRREHGANYGCYFTDMMHNAISEARKALADVPHVRAA